MFKRLLILFVAITAVIALIATGIGNPVFENFFNNKTDSAGEDSLTSSPPVPTESPAISPQPEIRTISIIAVGDIMFGRRVGKNLESPDKGYKYAFSKVKEILKSGDIVFGNLESPMTNSSKSLSRNRKIVLKCSPDAIEGLKDAGFNVLSLANNHIMDYYEQGLMDTIEILDKYGIHHSGAGKDWESARKPAIIEVNNITFGLLSYSEMVRYVYAGSPSISYVAGKDKAGAMPVDYEIISEDIAALRDKVDILAVSLHWGIEESFRISGQQIELARKLVDEGADMILGHHPHQFQGMEIYKGKPIIYSLGNILFDQNDPENMESFIIKMEYKDNRLTDFSAIPVRIVDKCFVEIQTGQDAVNILEREIELCNALGTGFIVENDILKYDLDSFAAQD